MDHPHRNSSGGAGELTAGNGFVTPASEGDACAALNGTRLARY